MSLIIDEDESGEEAQEGEAGQHRHGVRRQGVQSRQDAVHFETSLFNCFALSKVKSAIASASLVKVYVLPVHRMLLNEL